MNAVLEKEALYLLSTNNYKENPYDLLLLTLFLKSSEIKLSTKGLITANGMTTSTCRTQISVWVSPSSSSFEKRLLCR